MLLEFCSRHIMRLKSFEYFVFPKVKKNFPDKSPESYLVFDMSFWSAKLFFIKQMCETNGFNES